MVKIELFKHAERLLSVFRYTGGYSENKTKYIKPRLRMKVSPVYIAICGGVKIEETDLTTS